MEYEFQGEYGEWRPSMVGPIRHSGKDVPAPQGGYLFPPITGKVKSVTHDPLGYGINVIIQQGSKLVRLAHLQSTNVQKGDLVDPSRMIGTTGCSGVCTGAHVHYEQIRKTPFGLIYQRPPDVQLEIQMPVGGGIGQGIPDVGDAFGDMTEFIASFIRGIGDPLGDMVEFLANLTRVTMSPQLWLRIGASIIALVMLIMGINSLSKATLGVGVGVQT